MTRLRIREKFTPHDSGAANLSRTVDPNATILARNEKSSAADDRIWPTDHSLPDQIHFLGVLEAMEMKTHSGPIHLPQLLRAQVD